MNKKAIKLMTLLNMPSQADKTYEIVMYIIGTNIKDKLKHPFKDLDK